VFLSTFTSNRPIRSAILNIIIILSKNNNIEWMPHTPKKKKTFKALVELVRDDRRDEVKAP
jgi:hypothetical protein